MPQWRMSDLEDAHTLTRSLTQRTQRIVRAEAFRVLWCFGALAGAVERLERACLPRVVRTPAALANSFFAAVEKVD